MSRYDWCGGGSIRSPRSCHQAAKSPGASMQYDPSTTPASPLRPCPIGQLACPTLPSSGSSALNDADPVSRGMHRARTSRHKRAKKVRRATGGKVGKSQMGPMWIDTGMLAACRARAQHLELPLATFVQRLMSGLPLEPPRPIIVRLPAAIDADAARRIRAMERLIIGMSSGATPAPGLVMVLRELCAVRQHLADVRDGIRARSDGHPPASHGMAP